MRALGRFTLLCIACPVASVAVVGWLAWAASAMTIASATTDARPVREMQLAPVGAAHYATLHNARVWTWAKAHGRAGTPDIVSWTSSFGELAVVITGHPRASGLDGALGIAGDCTMVIRRPDLAGTVLTVMQQDEGPDVFVFTKPNGDRIQTVLRAHVVPSTGCAVGR